VKRWEIIVLIAGAAVAWPLAARPQRPGKIDRIGLLGDTSWEALRQRLRDLGYVEGQTIALEPRSSEGQSERWSDLATELVRQRLTASINITFEIRWAGGDAKEICRHASELAALAPDVILATGAVSAGPLLEASRSVPIVFVIVPDPSAPASSRA